MSNFWENKIEFLKGVGPQKAALINKELNIFTYLQLIQHYPFRHEDRTRIYPIAEIKPDMPNIQIHGQILNFDTVGEGPKKRLVALFSDGTGTMELIWFQGVTWQLKNLKLGIEYLVFGKPQLFGQRYSIVHPEMEVLTSRL